MEGNKMSLTALITAYTRAYHAMHDDPKIFDDFLACHMFTEEEFTNLGRNLAQALKVINPERAASCPDEVTALARTMQTLTATLGRSRYTEDILETAVQQGVEQYVILGAGLDTFAFRHPELKSLKVFETDHPATQSYKRHRLDELGWELPPQLHFLPVDFTKESLATTLKSSLYDPQKLTFISWLGVTYYLPRDAVFATLRSIVDITPAGSIIVFDYMDTTAFDPETAAKGAQRDIKMTRNIGEPMITGFDPASLAADLAGLGLRLHENLSPSEIEGRYFHGRTDGYHASEHMHYARAVVE